MGQLRNGILALQKSTINTEPLIVDLEHQQDVYTQQVYDAGKRIGEGLNTLVSYLLEKLKKSGQTFEKEGTRPLKDFIDSNVTTFGKGIVQAKGDVKAIVARLSNAHKASAQTLLNSIKESKAEADKLRVIADKKKSKLLKSAKYKTKITGYLAALDAIEKILEKQVEAINEVAALNQNDTWVDRNYKFDQNMTMAQVRNLASIDFNSNLKDFNENKGNIQNHVRKFRDDWKTLGPQLAQMKKWSEDADGMEAESEEK